MRNLVDRLAGWLVVTLVGGLTALSAFLIVRGEQWLFDIKEGYCATGWYRAKHFCCPSAAPDDDIALRSSSPVFVTLTGTAEEACDAWRTWAQVLSKDGTSDSSKTVIEYFAYGFFAVRDRQHRTNMTLLTSSPVVTRPAVLSVDNISHTFHFLHHPERFRRSGPPI